MIKDLVSVMMPAYNAEKYIGQAIDSVLIQTYPNWELIVVNDGSTDNTSLIVGQYKDPRIKLINQINGGEASARNTALKNMRGEFLAFVDSDDCYLPNHLEMTVTHLQQYSEIDAVYTDGYYINPSGETLQSLSDHRRGPFKGRLFEQLVRASDVFGPPICIVMRRSLIDQHNFLYDTRIIIGPDWDFNTHYAEYALFDYIDQHTCLYRVHDTNITIIAGHQKRINSLALCREKAVKLPGFADCSLETRHYVFYDLLINLLTDNPEKQEEVTRWKEFIELPASIQSRLFRLMASQAIVGKKVHPNISNWLHRSQKLNPQEFTARLLATLYSLSPSLCYSVLRIRRLAPSKRANETPFGKL
jgi:glycosyltransferase involved in cell wall biosynthesis